MLAATTHYLTIGVITLAMGTIYIYGIRIELISYYTDRPPRKRFATENLILILLSVRRCYRYDRIVAEKNPMHVFQLRCQIKIRLYIDESVHINQDKIV